NLSVRRLIVTEKFNASIRIATILSGGKSKRSYVEGTPVFEFAQGEDRVQVVGLRGHIINLDYPDALNDWARVDLKELVWAEPQKVVTAGKIGAALTRFISIASKRLGRDFLSVGRVQSPTLALIVGREREIENFVPQDFWTVHAKFRKDVAGAPVEFETNHEHGPFWARREAET